MTHTEAPEQASAGHEALLCKTCGRTIRMRNGQLLTCTCGAAPPKGCWTRRAVPSPTPGAAPLVYVERIEKARKPCTNPVCDGCMVFSATARRHRRGSKTPADRGPAWTCRTCGRQDRLTDH